MPMTEADYDQQALDLLMSKFPKLYNVKTNKFINALLQAISLGDGYISSQVQAVRDNSIAVTATGRFLDRSASLYGIVRGQGTGILDADFQKLIPILGLSYKQISHILLEIIDTIYGPLASHANLTATNAEPYNLINGFSLNIRVDDTSFKIVFDPTDAINLASASADEISTAISKKTQGRLIGSVISEASTGKKFLNIRTSTIGSQGFLQILGGDAQSKFRFPNMRDVTEGLATWDVTRYLGTDEMVYTVTSGPVPNLLATGVIRNDFCTIRMDSGFNIKNTGTFPITFVGSNFFRIVNGDGIPQTGITQAHNDDFTFYQPKLSNVLTSSRPAALVETEPRVLTIILPVTSPLVKRTIKGSHHYHQGLTTVTAATTNSVTLASTAGFQTNGAFLPTLSRKPAKAIISSVGPTTITLIDNPNFPNQGAFWISNTRQFFYYNGISGNVLTGVTPTPTANLAGITIKYQERFSYTGMSGNVLTGVYPDPSSLLNNEISACGAITGANDPGSYLYDLQATFTISQNFTTTSDDINQGTVKTLLNVSDVSSFPDQGFFVIDYGTSIQEGPIRYLAKVGTKGLIIDPSHVFQFDHFKGTGLRQVGQIGPYIPRIDGTDLAVYSTSTSPARDQLAKYLQSIAASGVILNFVIKTPDEKWPVLPNLFTTDPLAISLV